MLTPQDYIEFPNYTDEAILGTKLIRSLRDEVLLKLVENPQSVEWVRTGAAFYLFSLQCLVGEKTNPNWIMMRVADEAYERGLITESQWDVLGEKHG